MVAEQTRQPAHRWLRAATTSPLCSRSTRSALALSSSISAPMSTTSSCQPRTIGSQQHGHCAAHIGSGQVSSTERAVIHLVDAHSSELTLPGEYRLVIDLELLAEARYRLRGLCRVELLLLHKVGDLGDVRSIPPAALGVLLLALVLRVGRGVGLLRLLRRRLARRRRRAVAAALLFTLARQGLTCLARRLTGSQPRLRHCA